MAKNSKNRGGRRPSVLLQMYDNALLRTKVDSALDSKMGYEDIVELCAKYNVKMSIATLSRYAKARRESIRNGTSLRKALDGVTKSTVDRLKGKEADAVEDAKEVLRGADATTPVETIPDASGQTGAVTKYWSDSQVLDTIISRGYEMIAMGDAAIAPKDLLKAIEVKAKLNNNANQGLSLEGLQELRVHVMARDTAIAEVLMRYVPEDKQKEALVEIDKVEQETLKNMDVTAQGKEILKALHEGGIKL